MFNFLFLYDNRRAIMAYRVLPLPTIMKFSNNLQLTVRLKQKLKK